jgi:hypothetical protein
MPSQLLVLLSHAREHSLIGVRRHSRLYRCLHEYFSLHPVHEAVTEAELFRFVPRYPRTPPLSITTLYLSIKKQRGPALS